MSGIKIATRDAVGPALVELGEENDDIVVLDAKPCESTKTVAFKKRFPSRFFDCRKWHSWSYKKVPDEEEFYLAKK